MSASIFLSLLLLPLLLPSFSPLPLSFSQIHLLAGNLKVNGLERSLTVPLAKIKTKPNKTT